MGKRLSETDKSTMERIEEKEEEEEKRGGKEEERKDLEVHIREDHLEITIINLYEIACCVLNRNKMEGGKGRRNEQRKNNILDFVCWEGSAPNSVAAN